MYKISSARRKSRLSNIVPPTPPSIWERISNFFRHPAIVVTLGFFFSGIVGAWITHLNDTRQKARDAIIKNQDAYREAMDDFQVGADTIAAGINHITIRLNGPGKATSLQQAEQDYLSSYLVWAQKFSKDRNIIEQQFSGTPFSSEMSVLLTNIQGGFEVVDYCIQFHIAVANSSDDYKSQPAECKFSNSTIDIRELLKDLRVCTHAITVSLRPDPRYDFAPEDVTRTFLSAKMTIIRQYCPTKKIAAGTDTPVSPPEQKPAT